MNNAENHVLANKINDTLDNIAGNGSSAAIERIGANQENEEPDENYIWGLREQSKQDLIELLEWYKNQTLQDLKAKVEDRISVIRDSIHEVEDKMNRYTFSAKEKREGSTHYGALQERETRYKRQIKELQTVITLIDEAINE